MPRHCPDCGAQMDDDTVHCVCPAAGCTFRGYVVLRTGKILRDGPDEEVAARRRATKDGEGEG